MKKRLAALLLAFIMLFSMTAGAFADEIGTENTPEPTTVSQEGSQINSTSDSSANASDPNGEAEADSKNTQENVQPEAGIPEMPSNSVNPVSDAAAAQAVMDVIASIGAVTPETAYRVENAARAYEALSDAQKALVENFDDLLLALSEYMKLEAVPTQSAAPEVSPMPEESENSITWTLDENGILVIVGTGAVPDYSLSSPAPWMERAQEICALIVSEGITTLGENALNGCAALEQVNLPQSLLVIGNDVFAACDALCMVELAGGEEQIENLEIGSGNEAFCAALPGLDLQTGAPMLLQSDVLPANVLSTAPELSELIFRKGNQAQAQQYAMQPTFDPKVREYSIVVPDTVNPINEIAIWATLPEGVQGEIIAEYVNLINGKTMHKSIVSGAELGTTIMGCVRVKSLQKNALTIQIDGSNAYTVNLVKQPTLSDLKISVDGENVELDVQPNPSVSEYNASVDVNAQVSLSVQTTSENVNVRFNGGESGVLTPVWSGRDCDITIRLNAADTQAKDYTLHLHQKPQRLEIVTQPLKTEYSVGEYFDKTGLQMKAVYADGGSVDVPIEDVTFDITQPLTKDITKVTLKYLNLETEVSVRVGGGLKGSGTQADPWLVENASDFETVREFVENGMCFEGEYLKMTDNIELPENWSPIGSTMEKAFKGNLNGDQHLLTVPTGGLPLLGCVQGASVSNLYIFGERIEGYGLVNDLQGVGISGVAISIDHVTLKSGSSTLKAGLIGTKPTVNLYAGCSKDFLVNISNCTVESGVVIGYAKDQSMIGSFAGRINGTISNCTSAAVVYGKDYVGGILGSRDNALGTCKVKDCSFTGTVQADGEQAGGIVGGGYSDSTAPNGIRISIDRCSSSGNISGKDKVGGILGGDIMVAQAWDAYTFTNNSFTGKVSGSGSTVGGVIGYYRSLNRLDDITGNYYASNCGAKSGFGYVMYVDTNCASHETASGALYFNTETDISACPEVAGCAWKMAHNRDDDPLGANAAKLMRTDGVSIVEVTSISLDQSELNLKIGDTATLRAQVAPENATDNTVRWVSGDESVATVANGIVTAKGFGETVITASAGKFSAKGTVKVTADPAENITVYMTVSKRGLLAQAQDGSAMFNRSVDVRDINSDGVLTYDERSSPRIAPIARMVIRAKIPAGV